MSSVCKGYFYLSWVYANCCSLYCLLQLSLAILLGALVIVSSVSTGASGHTHWSLDYDLISQRELLQTTGLSSAGAPQLEQLETKLGTSLSEASLMTQDTVGMSFVKRRLWLWRLNYPTGGGKREVKQQNHIWICYHLQLKTVFPHVSEDTGTTGEDCVEINHLWF